MRLVPVAGLPRSGSTALVNLFAQNPRHVVTPTSGLPELVGTVRDRWATVPAFQAEGLQQVRPKVLGALRGLIEGYHDPAAEVVLDKNRAWLPLLDVLEEVYGRPMQVLVPVRDVRDIVASFERLYQRDPITRKGGATPLTVRGRAEAWLHPGSAVGSAIEWLRDALRTRPDRLLVVPYPYFADQPQEMMRLLHEALGLPPYDYDPGHVEQVTKEDDAVHGILGLHDVRSKVERPSHSWEDVLPGPLAAEIARAYADIHELLPG